MWQPSQEGVQQIRTLLTDYQKPGTDQALIFAQLKHCENIPDFSNYLSYIFAQDESSPLEVRQSAGLLLKNNLRGAYAAAPPEFKVYIRTLLLPCLAASNKAIRHTAGTIVSVIVGAAGMAEWPELIKAMMEVLGSLAGESCGHEVDGVLDALYKICEDHPVQVDVMIPELGSSTASAVVPRLLAQFQSPVAEVRRLSLGCVNMIVQSMPNGMETAMEPYLQGMFALATDTHSGVRRLVCAGLVQMLQLSPEMLEPHIRNIIEYMLHSTSDGDEEVALESCEFWSAFCEAQIPSTVLAEFLPRLIPVLMKNMMFDELDDEVLEVEAADDAVNKEDADSTIKPFVHHSHAHREEEAEEDDAEVNLWNLRKCSASGLDVLSTVFNDTLLPVLMPIIQQRLQDADWRARESAVLALGAISEGCSMGLRPHLDEIVTTIMPLLEDPKPLVRVISCWGLSRYSEWIVQNATEGGKPQEQFDQILQGILKRMLDSNRKVQEAACSALATFEEVAGGALLPRLESILQCIAVAAERYGRRNIRLLYDAINTLAEAVGDTLASPAAMQMLMPPLWRKWEALADTDKDLLPLMNCLVAVAQNAGPAFEDFAPSCFQRSCSIITAQLQATATGAPERSEAAIMVALDLITGLAEGLGASMDALIAASPPGGSPHLRLLLVECCRDKCPEIRQSAFALVGDLAKCAVPQLAAAVPQLLELAVKNLEPAMLSQATMSACNNAAWSMGELAIKVSEAEVEPFAVPAVERLVPILVAQPGQMPRSLQENSAITIGRIAWICPQPIAPHLAHFIGPWCQALRIVRDDIEKEHAFLGLCACVRLNADGALGGFPLLCEAITSWRQLACEGLRNELSQIMHSFRAKLQASGQWDQALASLSPAVREKLVLLCGL